MIEFNKLFIYTETVSSQQAEFSYLYNVIPLIETLAP